MKPIVSDPRLTGSCGLYCGACRKYRKGKCPGCRNGGWQRCTYNNLAGRLLALLFNSDRAACISYIRRYGRQAFADRMAQYEQMTMKRK